MSRFIIFEEHFENNQRHWFTVNNAFCEARVEDNAYIFEHKRGEASWLVWCSAGRFYDSSYAIKAKIEQQQGDDNSRGYGLVWGLRDTSNFLEFILMGSDTYSIGRWERGQYTMLYSGAANEPIKPDTPINTLELRQQGNKLEFLVNDNLLTKIPVKFIVPFGEQVGFVIYGHRRIRVHELTVAREANEGASPTTHSTNELSPGMRISEASLDDTLAQTLAELHALVGLEHVKQEVRTLTNTLRVHAERRRRGLDVLRPSLHLVLYGPPGTGKTTVARLIGQIYKHLGFLERGHTVEVNRAGLVAAYIGQTAIRTEQAIDQATGGVLFVDEAYALAPKQLTYRDYGAEALEVILKQMEDRRDKLAVIFAGYTEPMRHLLDSNPGVRSRFNRSLFFDHYAPEELGVIFEHFASSAGYLLSEAAQAATRHLFERTRGAKNPNFGNARFVRNIFERALEAQANRIADEVETLGTPELVLLTEEDLLAYTPDPKTN